MRVKLVQFIVVMSVCGCGEVRLAESDLPERVEVLPGSVPTVTGVTDDSGAETKWPAPETDAGAESPAPEPDAGTESPARETCADIYSQDLLPTFEVEIAPAEWDAIREEFLTRDERLAAGLDPHPWHPIVFRYGSETRTDAMIRLRGRSSWEEAARYDADPKMQFAISFNEVRSDGRFHGLRKIVLDMPRTDKTFLRQRLALSYLRDLGLPAQCANNARLEINGEYYGLFTNLELIDKEFLERVFPGEEDGDLWKGGWELRTNESTSTGARRNALFAATTIDEVEALVDLEASVLEWAGEAMIPDADGYFAGTRNYQLYDHPSRGFVWVPSDVDQAFDYVPHDGDPVFWKYADHPAPHWTIVLRDRRWMDRYVDLLEMAWTEYRVHTLEDRIATWSAQIARAAEEDPRRPFSMDRHRSALEAMSAYLSKRAAFVREWIDCRRSGGSDPDGDGAIWCFDCAEGDPGAYPGAPEVCGNGRDESCDGYADDHCG